MTYKVLFPINPDVFHAFLTRHGGQIPLSKADIEADLPFLLETTPELVSQEYLSYDEGCRDVVLHNDDNHCAMWLSLVRCVVGMSVPPPFHLGVHLTEKSFLGNFPVGVLPKSPVSMTVQSLTSKVWDWAMGILNGMFCGPIVEITLHPECDPAIVLPTTPLMVKDRPVIVYAEEE